MRVVWRPGFRPCILSQSPAAEVPVATATYLEGVTWEPRADIEARIAHLLPALFLARIDGKSTIEYVTDEHDKDRVRAVARSLIMRPRDRLDAIRAAWAKEV